MEGAQGADSVLQLVNSQPLECDKLTLPCSSEGGTPEAKATFRGQLVIMRMNGRQTILGVCCTR